MLKQQINVINYEELSFFCRWQKAKFGDHTYVKKMKGKRPVGATHAGKRPKTAPHTFQERWKSEKVI